MKILSNAKKSLQLPVFLWAGLFIFCGMSTAFGQRQEGLGTYYHDKYHGKPTASGEIYNKNDFTAAHKKLPFGTRVKVTRMDNGAVVYVKINDRGPFSPGRIIDLSRAAAAHIGMIRSGEVRVRIEVVSDEAASSNVFVEDLSRPRAPVNSNRDLNSLPLVDHNGRPANAGRREFDDRDSRLDADEEEDFEEDEEFFEEEEDDFEEEPVDPNIEKYTPQLFQMIAFKKDAAGYGVQVGAFFNFYRLLEALNELSAKGVQNSLVQSSSKDGSSMFRIIVGPYATKTEANASKKRLAKKRYKGITVNLSDLN